MASLDSASASRFGPVGRALFNQLIGCLHDTPLVYREWLANCVVHLNASLASCRTYEGGAEHFLEWVARFGLAGAVLRVIDTAHSDGGHGRAQFIPVLNSSIARTIMVPCAALEAMLVHAIEGAIEPPKSGWDNSWARKTERLLAVKWLSACVADGTTVVPLLRRLLADDDHRIRWWAARHLSQLDPASMLAVPELVEALMFAPPYFWDQEAQRGIPGARIACDGLMNIGTYKLLKSKRRLTLPKPAAWAKVQLSTESPHMARAEAAVRAWYQGRGEEPPERILWCGSPFAGAVAALSEMARDLCLQLGAPHTVDAWKMSAVFASYQVSLRRLGVTGARQGMRSIIQDGARQTCADFLGGLRPWLDIWRATYRPVAFRLQSDVVVQAAEYARTALGVNLTLQTEDLRFPLPNPNVEPEWRRMCMPDPLADPHWQLLNQLFQRASSAEGGIEPGGDKTGLGMSLSNLVSEVLLSAGHGRLDADWVGLVDCLEKLGLPMPAVAGLCDLTRSCGWWFPLPGACILTCPAELISRDSDQSLHGQSGAAIAFADGWGVYAWHGVAVPAFAIETPELITVEQIDKEDNLELRRVLIDRYGFWRYLRHSGGELVGEDRCGQIYRKQLPFDEPLVVVRVVNSSPEPDGSFREYYLRVPPDTTSARQGVAWTFGLKPRDYRPCAET